MNIKRLLWSLPSVVLLVLAVMWKHVPFIAVVFLFLSVTQLFWVFKPPGGPGTARNKQARQTSVANSRELIKPWASPVLWLMLVFLVAIVWQVLR